MKTAVVKIVCALSLATAFAGCGVGQPSQDEYTAQQQKDAQALNQRFDVVKGTYDGTFSNPDAGIAPHKARLLLYVINVNAGANPDGTVRVRPALYARFQLVDIVGQTDYLSMQGDVDALGNLQMTSLAGQASGGGITGGTGGGTQSGGGAGSGGSTAASGDTATISIKGTLVNGVATVDVSNTGGYWGRFVGDRTSSDAAAPSFSDAEELRERLLATYRTIEGSYQAVVDTGSTRMPVEIKITIAEPGTGGTGISIPYLVAQYRRLDFPAGVAERQLAVNYDALSGRISMNAIQGGSTTVPGSQYFAASGTWANQNLDVTLRDSRGYEGELKAVRKPLTSF